MDKKKIALLSNITIDLVNKKLKKEYDVYYPKGFDTWIQEVIGLDSELYTNDMDAIIILLDGFEARTWKSNEEAKQRFDLWKQAVLSLTKNFKDIPIFISTIDIRESRVRALNERSYSRFLKNDWYDFTQSIAESQNNIYVFDLESIIVDIGRENFYSNKMWYLSNMPYSRIGLDRVSTEIKRLLNSCFLSKRKIVVLDLDNTLWGGVIGEDGIQGIELSNHHEGQRFYDFQSQFYKMKELGILLALNSKNNLEDVDVVLKNHPNMLLKDDDFVIKKINWDNKASNLKQMENELNLTEGSFIFIDDNPIEREIVHGECPDIVVPYFPDDTSTLYDFAENVYLDYCFTLNVLDEDRKKTEMYQVESKRKMDYESSINLEDFIAKLEIHVDIHPMRLDETDRVVQLINKTNQFNTTTKRYTKAEIKNISSNPDNVIYVMCTKDKYGDNGLISIIILTGQGNNTLNIDSFLMSCRVMGRNLEHVIINEVCNLFKNSYEKITASYYLTTKNAPVKKIYEQLGFHLISEQDENKFYEKNIVNYAKKEYLCYKEISFKH